MSRKVITFLGTMPKDTVYEYDGKRYPGKVFAEALCQFVPFDEMYVFVTKEAREKSYPELTKLNDNRIQPVDIDPGKDIQEMWGWFDKILECVNDGDMVIFDITHGLRSIPFLVFIFAAFLKSARNVTIEAIYYGAFELGNKEMNKPAPVIELSEFVSMFDWLTAVNEFIYTGNANYLAKQLTDQKPEELRELAENVSLISLGLELLRPRTVSEAAWALPANLKLVESNLPRPFSVVAQPLETAYAQFGLEQNASAGEHLRAQLHMINWYFEKERFVQALSMSREWVISLLCVHFSEDMWSKEGREDIELLLNGARKNDQGQVTAESRHAAEWKKDNRQKIVANLWSGPDFKLANLRNDVLHSGFRKSPGKAEEIIRQSERIINQINAIADLWDILEK